MASKLSLFLTISHLEMSFMAAWRILHGPCKNTGIMECGHTGREALEKGMGEGALLINCKQHEPVCVYEIRWEHAIASGLCVSVKWTPCHGDALQ